MHTENAIERIRSLAVVLACHDSEKDAMVSVEMRRVAEVARTLRQHHVHRVLVATGDAFVGLISTFDLIAVLEKDVPKR